MIIEQLLLIVEKLFNRKWESMVANGHSTERNPCFIASDFGYFGDVDAAWIETLTSTGAILKTKRTFNVGEAIRLKLPLHNLDRPVEIAGVIHWTGPDGVGIKFRTGENEKANSPLTSNR